MKILRIIIICIAILFISSCKNDNSDLDRYFEEAKLSTPPQIDPLPEINSPEIFIYEAEEMRDPFSNDLQLVNDIKTPIKTIKKGEGPDLDRRKEILESYPLDSLFMVGTYMQEEDYWGLIEDPEGVIHRVSLNKYMGQNYGKIISVNEDRINVSEWISDGLDGWTKRKASIALREE